MVSLGTKFKKQISSSCVYARRAFYFTNSMIYRLVQSSVTHFAPLRRIKSFNFLVFFGNSTYTKRYCDFRYQTPDASDASKKTQPAVTKLSIRFKICTSKAWFLNTLFFIWDQCLRYFKARNRTRFRHTRRLDTLEKMKFWRETSNQTPRLQPLRFLLGEQNWSWVTISKVI